MKVMILDLETEYHTSLVRGSTPFDPTLGIICAGWCVEDQYGGGVIDGVWLGNAIDDTSEWFKIPDDVGMLVGHNIAFDLQWLLHRQSGVMRAFFARGGRVFDTALGHFLLSGFMDKYPALNTIAPEYGGTPKADMVAELWRRGKWTSEIPRELLYDEYLMQGADAEVFGDIENTRRVFWGQVDQLVQRGMWAGAMSRMDGLLGNTLCMFNGLHVDTKLAADIAESLGKEYEALDSQINVALGKQLPDGAPVKRTLYGLSSLLWGGYYSYAGTTQRTNKDGTPMWVKAPHYEVAGQMIPVENYTEGMGEPTRYKSGKNKGAFKVFDVETTEPILKKDLKVVYTPGILPLKNLPEDFRKVVEDSAGKLKFGDGTPVLSSSTDIIEGAIALPNIDDDARQVLRALNRMARIDKDLGTYYIRETAKGTSGALQYIDPRTNLIHHELNVVSTRTGRLSSSKPNFQNLPRGDTAEVKKIYTSRFNDPMWLEQAFESGEIDAEVYTHCLATLERGELPGRIVEIDYTALEVVTLAAFSKDPNLVEALLSGKDMHCMRLAAKLGEDYESVLVACHNPEHPDHRRYKVMRTEIKPPAFAYQYGATAHGIALSCGMSVEEAQAFIDREKALFPGVEEWYEKVVFKEILGSKRYERRMMGDGSYQAVGLGTWTAPSGAMYTFQQYPTTIWEGGTRVNVMRFKPTQMRNYPIQGESSFFVQLVMGVLARSLLKKTWRTVYLINQVHDAVYFDCQAREVETVVRWAKTIMESIPTRVAKLGYDLGVPFPVAAEAGPSMYEKITVEV